MQRVLSSEQANAVFDVLADKLEVIEGVRQSFTDIFSDAGAQYVGFQAFSQSGAGVELELDAASMEVGVRSEAQAALLASAETVRIRQANVLIREAMLALPALFPDGTPVRGRLSPLAG
jgi:hypothetical protein